MPRENVEAIQRTNVDTVRQAYAEAVGRTPHVWTMRDGKGSRFQLFQTWTEALEAVGLSE